jgi:hypothetical protein
VDHTFKVLMLAYSVCMPHAQHCPTAHSVPPLLRWTATVTGTYEQYSSMLLGR